MQIMVAQLGLDVLFSPEETLKGRPHWTVTQEINDSARDEGLDLVTVLPDAAAAEAVNTHPPATDITENMEAE